MFKQINKLFVAWCGMYEFQSKDTTQAHYIIESRNLFNSKMTETMSEEIVDILSKYDTTHVFTLDAFKCVLKITKCNNVLLKNEALISTIMACFKAYLNIFVSHVLDPSFFWDSYIPHNGENGGRSRRTTNSSHTYWLYHTFSAKFQQQY
jgi:hypothetical protein